MKSANLLVLLLCCICMHSQSQNSRSPIVAWYTSSGAYSKNFSDVFSINNNIAALATVKNFSAAVYGEKRFMLSALGLYSAVLATSTSSGNFSLSANYYGYAAYNESEISIGYGRKLSDKVDIGVKFNYFSLLIPSYGKAAAFNFDAGAVFHITEQLHSGINIYNPLSSKLGKHTAEKLMPVYKAGLGYDFSASFFTGVEVIKEQGGATGIHASFQYKPITQIFARAGIVTSNHLWYAGIGYLFKDLRVDITVSMHQQLGISPGILLLYTIKKQEKE
ncbi:MAG: hypothetical protein IT249_15020 [Chitinophagaceae bacterium]|nr:hypothetical protein [Chitinophagaceae bacterium]